MEMDPEVAGGMAEHVLGFFGFYDRIIDNALEPTDRNLFYMFQDYDLLTTESEETTLWDGREWRIHYWRFKPDHYNQSLRLKNVLGPHKQVVQTSPREGFDADIQQALAITDQKTDME